MRNYSSAQWIIYSDWSGAPLRTSRKHAYIPWAETTLCGVKIPRDNDRTISVDYGVGSPDCDKCRAVMERHERDDNLAAEREEVDAVVRCFVDSGIINVQEVTSYDASLERKRVINSIRRLGGKHTTGDWYRFEVKPIRSTR